MGADRDALDCENGHLQRRRQRAVALSFAEGVGCLNSRRVVREDGALAEDDAAGGEGDDGDVVPSDAVQGSEAASKAGLKHTHAHSDKHTAE